MNRRIGIAIVALACCTVLITSGTQAQAPAASADTATSPRDRRVTVDFAVPESPAFELVKVEDSNLLRPSTVREISAGLANFVGSDGELSLPQTLGIEFSPGLLFFGRGLTLQEYRANPIPYRFRMSIATSRPEAAQSPNEFAIGGRVNFLDQADLRTNPEASKRIHELLEQQIELDQECPIKIPESGNPEVVCPPEVEERLKKLSDRLQQVYADTMWNKNAFDVAAALRITTADTSGNDPQVSEVSGWATYAWATKGVPVIPGDGDIAGQLLIGGKAGFGRDSTSTDWKPQASVGVRYYIGTNRHKGYLEGQFLTEEGTDTGNFIGLGGELRVLESIWANLSIAFARDPDEDNHRLVTRFTFKGAAPR